MIVCDIDVTKLDKARFREGSKGQKYCDLVLIDYPSDKSDGFVKQGVTKEEREAGVQMPIIGNFRRFEKGGAPRKAAPAKPQRDEDLDEPKDEIPF